MNPLWRPIPGFPDYEASESGDIRSARTLRVIKQFGRGRVGLRLNGQTHNRAARDLVAEAWAAEPEPEAEPKVSYVEHSSRADRAELLDLAVEYDCLAGIVAELEAELSLYRASAGI